MSLWNARCCMLAQSERAHSSWERWTTSRKCKAFVCLFVFCSSDYNGKGKEVKWSFYKPFRGNHEMWVQYTSVFCVFSSQPSVLQFDGKHPMNGKVILNAKQTRAREFPSVYLSWTPRGWLGYSLQVSLSFLTISHPDQETNILLPWPQNAMTWLVSLGLHQGKFNVSVLWGNLENSSRCKNGLKIIWYSQFHITPLGWHFGTCLLGICLDHVHTSVLPGILALWRIETCCMSFPSVMFVHNLVWI
jgi:hypothetical protein